MSTNSNSPTINKYLTRLNNKLKDSLEDKNGNFFYIFRGLSSSEYALKCTAIRDEQERGTSDSLLNSWLKRHQEKIISDFKIKGIDRYSEKTKSIPDDLKILADLRHYGTPSCLIDFTSDFMIALWFACFSKDNEDKHGKICILNCYETDKFLRVHQEIINQRIGTFLDNYDENKKIWYWIPERLNQRLTDQDAVFIFGKPELEEKEYLSIEIDKGDKKDILNELEKFFDYSRSTLFSDKYAIGDNYRHDRNRRSNGEQLLDSAIYYIQIRNFKDAIIHLKEIIGDTKIKEKEEEKYLYLEACYQFGYAFKHNLQLKEDKKAKRDDESTIAQKTLEKIQSEEKGDSQGSDESVYKYSLEECKSKNYKKEEFKRMYTHLIGILKGIIEPEQPST